MRKLFNYLMLKLNLSKRMVVINETMALREVTDVYAENVCKMNGWRVRVGSGLSHEFCDIGFAFINGYTKALRDNGFEFQNGLVKKRDIANDMPIGALRHYKESICKEANENAVVVLREVLERYESSMANINTIVNEFKKSL